MNWTNGEYAPKQKRADEKKEQIINAALTLFGTHGYHNTTAKAIAAEAGVATGSFYRYFRDKKTVFMAVCHRMEAEIGGRIFGFGEKMRQEGHTEKEILGALIRFSIQAHHRHKAFHKEVLAMQIMDPDVAIWGAEREKRILAALHEFLEGMQEGFRIKDLEAAAELIYYVIEEVSHQAVLFQSPVGEARMVNALQEMLERYMFD